MHWYYIDIPFYFKQPQILWRLGSPLYHWENIHPFKSVTVAVHLHNIRRFCDGIFCINTLILAKVRKICVRITVLADKFMTMMATIFKAFDVFSLNSWLMIYWFLQEEYPNNLYAQNKRKCIKGDTQREIE